MKADSWTVADGKKAMQDRLASYGAGECPDMVLAAVDNQAQGVIEALEEAGITVMPVITGQDFCLFLYHSFVYDFLYRHALSLKGL